MGRMSANKKKAGKADGAQEVLLEVPAGERRASGASTVKGLTINEISERTGADRRSVGKWLESAGIEPLAAKGMGNREMKLYGPEALEAVASRKKKTKRTKRSLEPMVKHNGNGLRGLRRMSRSGLIGSRISWNRVNTCGTRTWRRC